MLIYSNFIGLSKVLYPLPFQGPISLVVALILLIFISFNKNGYVLLNGKRNIFIILFLLLINRNVDFKMNDYIPFFKTLIVILICFILSNIKNWGKYFINITIAFSVIQAIATIFLWIFPSIAINNIVPLFDSSVRNELVRQISNGYATGLCTHYSVNGIYLAIGSGVAIIRYSHKKTIKNLMEFILIFIALLLTAKRGPILFCIISLLVCYIVYNKTSIKSIIKFFSIIIIIFLAVMVIKDISIFKDVVERFTNFGADITGGRKPLYDLAYNMFTKNEIIGNGWGSYKYFANESIIGSIYGGNSFMYAHNVYLQVLAETGIIGLIMYLFFILFCLITNIKLIKNEFGLNKNLLTFSLFIQVYYILYSLTGNALYDFCIFIPYVLSISMCFSIARESKRRN